MSSSCEFTFNSALTPLDGAGTFDEKMHNELVMSLRAQIMQLDGTRGCHIERYGVSVYFVPEAVTPTAIFRHVKQVFNEAAMSGMFFQGLGGKKLRITRGGNTSSGTHRRVVEIMFPTSLITYPPLNSDEFDEEFFQNAVWDLTHQMTDLDGVLGWSIQYRYASLTIDRNVVSVAAAKEHLRRVFTNAVGNAYEVSKGWATRQGTFFPYVAAGQIPTFRFNVKNR